MRTLPDGNHSGELRLLLLLLPLMRFLLARPVQSVRQPAQLRVRNHVLEVRGPTVPGGRDV